MSVMSYRKSRLLQILAFALMAVAAVFAAGKLYWTAAKVMDTRSAEKLYRQQEWVPAEKAYKSAAANGAIRYKEQAAADALSALQPVTELAALLDELAMRSRQAEDARSIEAALAVYREYGELKEQVSSRDGYYGTSLSMLAGDGAGALFHELAGEGRIDTRLQDTFLQLKDAASQQMETEAKKKAFTDEPFTVLLQIPGIYFGGDKEKTDRMQASFKSFDDKRLSAALEKGGLSSMLGEGERLTELYKSNGFSQNWLAPGMEQLTLASLKSRLEGNDLEGFLQAAKQVESYKSVAYGGSQVSRLIAGTYSQQLEKGANLAASGKYREAVTLYQTLGSYKDTSTLVQNTELEWSLNEPKRLLEQASPGVSFSQVSAGKNRFGALVYAFGVSDKQTLVLAKISPEHVFSKAEASLGKGLKVRGIRDAGELAGYPALLVEGESSVRAARYAGYAVESQTLRQIFDFEADRFEVQQADTLVVTNDAAKGAGQDAYYKYKDSFFSFDRIKPDYVEIALDDLNQYKNIKVRFSCTILTSDDQAAVVLYKDAYILLTGVKLKPGPAVITGTWSGTETIMKGAQSIPAYKVQVASAQQ